MLSLLSLVIATASLAAPQPPLQHGVVFYLPQTAEETVSQLEAIRADGYNMIDISSWVWTVPTEGSDLRRVAQAALDWCDRNGMAVWLLHNIQWGSSGEGGDIEAALTDPAGKARSSLAPWAETLRGHPCVTGVLLGNEVGPGDARLFDGHPAYLAAFRQWLAEVHGDVGALNLRWGTQYASFADAQPPAHGPGAIDVQRFNRRQFARFYDALVAQVLRPVLGDKLYGSKGGASPYTLRQMPNYTVCSWDDLVANWPLWKIKLLCDTTGLPVFNSELHVYHDTYAYDPSPELTRYRYLTSAMLGEWMSASFEWGGWKKPQIAEIHARTPEVLADLRELEPVLRAFNAQPPAFSVLVTEANEEGMLDHPRLETAYASAASTGLPWSFLADLDLADLQAPVLLVDTPWLTAGAAQNLADASLKAKVVFVGARPAVDEYGRPLRADIVQALDERTEVLPHWAELRSAVPAVDLPAQYTELVEVPYFWWSPEKGNFHFPVRYPRLEARRSRLDGVRYVAIINHTREEVTAPAPFVAAGEALTDALTKERLDPTALTFGPLDVRLLRMQ